MKSEPLHSRKFSIRFTVGSLFLFATAVTAFIAISLQYYFGKQMSQEHVLSKLVMATTEVSEYIQQVDANAASSASILRSVSIATQHQFSENETRQIFTQVLKDNPLFYSLYFGTETDDFYQIVNLASSPIVREKIDADPEDRWVIIKINGEGDLRLRQTQYFTEKFELTKSSTETSNYFPTQRPWFDAATQDGIYKTAPYLFQHLKITGQTYSVRSKQAVIGVDIVLSAINEKINPSELGMSEDSGAESFVFNDKGEVIASNISLFAPVEIPNSKPLKLSPEQQQIIMNTRSLMVSNQNDWGPYDYAQAGQPNGYSVDMLRLVAEQTGLQIEFINGFDSKTLVDKYIQNDIDILHSVAKGAKGLGYQSVSMFEGELAIASRGIKNVPKGLDGFQQQKVGVVSSFGLKGWLLDRYSTLNILELPSLDIAKEALQKGQIDYLIDNYHTLEELKSLDSRNSIELTTLKTSEKPSYHLFMKESDGSVLAIVNQALSAITAEQKVALNKKWLDSSQWRGSFVPYPKIYEITKDSEKHDSMIPVRVNGEMKYVYVTPLVTNGRSVEYFAVVIPQSVVTEQVFSKLVTSTLATGLVMMGLIPLAWKFGSPIVRPITELREVTEQIKARNFGNSMAVNTRIKEVSELSDSVVEMAEEIQRHEKQQDEFVEAFIRLIAQAIDDKSPYTAGHCNRVPEIGLMLAEAAEASTSGKFKDFKFNNADERREFRIAAWLHDCGKITTPEHIVDKGTKLEANYNRINEIRTRFEVLWRDAEIQYLKTILSGELTKEEARDIFFEKKRKLTDDFEFIAQANIGGEFMSDEKVERIKQIAQQTWLRHFDDRLGLSPFEELNKKENSVNLPVVEKLLADKPEHIIHRIRPVEFDPKHGIKMQVPEHQYNMGEVYNLSISRGTLTAEDRYKINEHMISGIKMLEALPFPPELRNVPRYASTHHETLKGSGYPRKLSAEDLSVPERILVIADIFEALTAADRPYKKAKPVSVAVDIMYKMALDEHLDMELFQLFLESGVYLEYANTFLPSKQVDHVDINKYLGANGVEKQSSERCH